MKRIIFFLFLVFTIFIICFSAYQVLDYGVTLMYAEAPGGWYDGSTEDVNLQSLYEEVMTVQLAYIRMFIISVIQLVLGIILYLSANRKNS